MNMAFSQKYRPSDKVLMNLLVVVRVLAGLLFFFSGFSKLTRPNEYFQIAIAQFALFPHDLVPLIGHVVPWIEIILGVHLLFGLYIKGVATGLAILTGCFQLILAQAVIRQLHIDECGCFGGGTFHLTLYQSFVLDTLLSLILIWIASSESSPLSLDKLTSRR